MPKTLFGSETRAIKPYEQRKGVTKPVLQIKDGIVINRFDSIGEAGRQTNISSCSISHVCHGRNKTTGGYAWRYAEYDIPTQKHTKTHKKVTAIKKERKGPFKVVITELCNSEEEAKTLLKAFSTGAKNINAKKARIIQTRKRK